MPNYRKSPFTLITFSPLILKPFVISLLVSLFFFQSTWAAPLQPNDLISQGALVMDLKKDVVLLEKNSNQVLYPASTTKLMTALLAVENLSPGRIITAPANFPYVGGSMIHIQPGETFTMEQLIQGLMVKSGNDAATLLAIEISGSIENFAKMMNERARELGCANTHFMNPHGLHDPQHYTTVHDLSLIAKAVLRDAYLRQVMAMPSLVIQPTNKYKTRSYNNTNRFLWDARTLIPGDSMLIPINFDTVYGVKTGTTREAGSCLVAMARIDDNEYLAIGLKSKDTAIYTDLRRLFDYALSSSFEKIILSSPSPVLGHIPVPNTKEEQLAYYTESGYYTYTSPGSSESFQVYRVFDANISLPLKKDQIIGYLSIRKNSLEIAKVPIQASHPLTPLNASIKSAPIHSSPYLIHDRAFPQESLQEAPELKLLFGPSLYRVKS